MESSSPQSPNSPASVVSWDKLWSELGPQGKNAFAGRADAHWLGAHPDVPFTIQYTSGTTGVPKGVVLTQDAFVSVLQDLKQLSESEKLIRAERERIVSFLPYSHIMGRLESWAIHVFGWETWIEPDVDSVARTIQEAKPTLLFGVPRFFEKARLRILEGISQLPSVQKKTLEHALQEAQDLARIEQSGRRGPLALKLRVEAYRRTIFRPIRKRLGGALRFAISGGAPLARRVGLFFDALGIPILEGYGLSETTGPATLNTPRILRYGSVGRPLPEVSVRIAPDGEIWIKSRKVFQEYFRDEASTAAAFPEGRAKGWFATGDIGQLDKQGFLTITDRKKDLLVTSGGKNIAPQKIENVAKRHPWINEFVVLGDARQYLVALIVLHPEPVLRHAEEQKILFSGYPELLRHPKIVAQVQKILDDEINPRLARYETIKRFTLLSEPFTVSGGELTPSLKVRRSWVARKFEGEIQKLY